MSTMNIMMVRKENVEKDEERDYVTSTTNCFYCWLSEVCADLHVREVYWCLCLSTLTGCRDFPPIILS